MTFLIRVIFPKELDDGCESPRGDMSLKELRMEEAIQQIILEENIQQDVWKVSRNEKYVIVEFPVVGLYFAERILDKMAYFNVGKTDDSQIMIIEPAALVHKKKPSSTMPSNIQNSSIHKFVNSLKSRLTVAQVYHAVSQKGNFDFNYLIFLICAAVIANMALVTGSAASVVASMLLSPVMEPITCIIFGMSLREKSMTQKGLKNATASIIICILVGFFFGPIAHYVSMFEYTTPYPTYEMYGRARVRSLPGWTILAATSGLSASFGILSNSLSVMIGNAISLSILPPAVNCGHFFFLAVLSSIQKNYVMETITYSVENTKIGVSKVVCNYTWIRDYNFIYVEDSCRSPVEFVALGSTSLGLTVLNIALVIITGYGVNKLKDMVPQSFTNKETRIFYTKDMKEVRDHYRCVHRLQAADLASQAYQEYLRLSNIDPEKGDLKNLTNTDGYQLNANFSAFLEGIENDRHLQTITAFSQKGKSIFIKDFVKAAEDIADQNKDENKFKDPSNQFMVLPIPESDEFTQFGGLSEEAELQRHQSPDAHNGASLLSSFRQRFLSSGRFGRWPFFNPRKSIPREGSDYSFTDLKAKFPSLIGSQAGSSLSQHTGEQLFRMGLQQSHLPNSDGVPFKLNSASHLLRSEKQRSGSEELSSPNSSSTQASKTLVSSVGDLKASHTVSHPIGVQPSSETRPPMQKHNQEISKTSRSISVHNFGKKFEVVPTVEALELEKVAKSQSTRSSFQSPLFF